MKREHAYKLRDMMHKAAESLPDEDALEAVELFKAWYSGIAYLAGERVRYEGKLYSCEQSHTSQVGWEPPVTPALWTEVAEPGEIDVWKQPTGAQDSYRIGTKVWYPAKNTTIYVSTLDYNTYPPDIFGWEVYVP